MPDRAPGPVYIIAGSKSQADQWADAQRIPPRDRRYLSRPEQVLGLADVDVHMVGTHWRSPVTTDRKFLAYAESHGLRLRRWTEEPRDAMSDRAPNLTFAELRCAHGRLISAYPPRPVQGCTECSATVAVTDGIVRISNQGGGEQFSLVAG